MKLSFSSRDKGILIGLYLSKFDKEGLKELGFDGMLQAYNVLGYSIGVKPASIKNYRDEFDPYFPNERKGRRNREIRTYCKKIMEDFALLTFYDFTCLIKSFLIQHYEVEEFIHKIEKRGKSESVAKRLITGKSAEEYFKMNYAEINQFKNYDLTDATNFACGFDFKLAKSESDFYCVEVKGLNLSSGSVMMTEKEFFVANELKQQYCLFVVSNFVEKPHHDYLFDPLNSRLSFKKKERIITQVTYLTQMW